MERLTVKWTDGVYDTFDPVDVVDNEYSKINYNKLLTKLGEYEDFEEIFRARMNDTACELLSDKEEFGKWLDRNKWIAKKCDEYARAEEQGLLLRLPCKVGDEVWIVGTKCLADVVPIEECERMQCGDCPYDYEDIVFKDKADARMISYLIFETHELFVFGKTVFLTKEEAEAKLKEMRGESE